ncbi:MAG: putative rane protein [Marmoricola sp.]|jgi:hypothetical protein|nr:putative rane protein [Marmoricola sp.]
MTCAYAESDGAYVLGALSATERLEFEQHLGACLECSTSVRQMAGLPGLLARVDPTVLDDLRQVEPVPDALLAHLVREVRRTRRRRLVLVGGLAAAAVAAVLTLTLSPLLGMDAAPPAAAPVGQVMTPLGDVPVRARLALQSVSWGTRLVLACTYAPDQTESDWPHTVTYTLLVKTTDGHTEQVSTWRPLEGRETRLTAATAARRQDIASVEVRTADGRPVLELSRLGG